MNETTVFDAVCRVFNISELIYRRCKGYALPNRQSNMTQTSAGFEPLWGCKMSLSCTSAGLNNSYEERVSKIVLCQSAFDTAIVSHGTIPCSVPIPLRSSICHGLLKSIAPRSVHPGGISQVSFRTSKFHSFSNSQLGPKSPQPVSITKCEKATSKSPVSPGLAT
jgi:hypothetical protein